VNERNGDKAQAGPMDYLDKGQQMLSCGEEELALDFFRRGISLDENNIELLKIYGETLMDMARVDQARGVFRKCIEIDPEDAGYWMYLGQLANGKEALEPYGKGIETLLVERKKVKSDSPEFDILSRQLCCAYCSLAELYMSDLCFEENAESECERFLTLALEISPDDPQALQGMASFRISQCKPEMAKPLILRALDIMEELLLKRPQQGTEGVDSDDDEDHMMEEEDEDDINVLESLLPPYEFRACTARILVELDEAERAIPFLEHLLHENDEIAEVWLLLGQCHMYQKDIDGAVECFERASELCDELVKMDSSLSSDEQFSIMMKKVKDFKDEACKIKASTN